MRPRSDFYTHVTKGRVYAKTYCKTHEKARVMAYQRANAERSNATSARAYAKRKMDPERFAIFRESRRQYVRKSRGITPDRYRPHCLKDIDTLTGRSTVTVDDARPFVAWFESVMERDGIALMELAGRLGVSDKTLRAIRDGERLPALETIERALFADDTATLDDLYPNLFQEAA